jgi:small subunit ribosomal protein S1
MTSARARSCRARSSASNKENVVVDIGYKSEGTIPVSEFVGAGGEVTVKPGDKVDVLVESREDDNGLVLLSKEKADKMKVWDEISAACERDEIIEGTISARVKGGLSVTIKGGVKAFLPGSQVDLRPIRNLDKLIGQRSSSRSSSSTRSAATSSCRAACSSRRSATT